MGNEKADGVQKNKIQLIILALMNYFTFMMITAIIGVLLGNWQQEFGLTPTISMLLGAAFFIAYGVTSLPLGILLEKIGSKKMFIGAASIIFLASILFATVSKSFIVGFTSLFVIGIGVTALQIVGNLLVKKIDEDPQKYSRNLTFAQVFCGLGAFSGGQLNKLLSENLPNFHWSYFYFLFAGMILVLGLLAAFSDIPEKDKSEIKTKPSISDYLKLIGNPVMLMYAIGIFIYVGIEVGVANWIVNFVTASDRGWEKMTLAAAGAIVAWYWGFQSIGRFTGSIVLNYLNTSKALIVYALAALGCLLIAVNVPVLWISQAAFIGVGFFTSIMFPSIFSLAVNEFEDKEDTVAGILCTAIIGGAVTSPLIGLVADSGLGLSLSLAILSAFSFLYIAFIGVKNLCSEKK